MTRTPQQIRDMAYRHANGPIKDTMIEAADEISDLRRKVKEMRDDMRRISMLAEQWCPADNAETP